MKNIFSKFANIKLAICLFAISGILAFTNNYNKDDAFSIAVGVDFGRGITCTGKGLCNFASTEKNASSGFDALGYYIVDKTGNAKLKVDKKSISYAKAIEQFYGEKIEIHHDIIMQNIGNRKSSKRKTPILITILEIPLTKRFGFFNQKK